MIKLKDLLKEDYTVNVQDKRKNKQIQTEKFTLKNEPNNYIKDMVKIQKLKRKKVNRQKCKVELNGSTYNVPKSMILV